MRCPRCGHEAEIEEYICSNCSYQLKVEPIERIPIFKRVTDKWYQPEKFFKRLLLIITNPARAFWDINHQKDKKGPFFIKFMNGVMIGLWALAVFSHLKIDNFTTAMILQFSVFLTFFLFGWIYYLILFWFYDFMFSLAANIAVQLDDILRVRYNVITKRSSLVDILSGKALRQTLANEEAASLANPKEKTMLKKIKDTGKFQLMAYAYLPILIANFISWIVLLVSLPTVDIGNTTNYWDYTTLATTLEPIFASNAWAVVDVIQIITLSVWVPITLSLAMREIGNTDTTKLLIAFLIMGVIMSYMIFFLRPTLGWNLNIIETYGNV